MIDTIKQRLTEKGIFHGDHQIGNISSVAGYEKKFKVTWFFTQLNTFIIGADFRGKQVNVQAIEAYLTDAFAFAKANYKGWPRGLQSGMGVIAIFVSESFDQEAINYCVELKSGKKWAGFSIPVAANAADGTVSYFAKKPMWGKIYYPHFEKLIKEVTSG